MNGKRKRWDLKRAFSILEVAIAISILSLIIIFVIGMYTRLLNTNSHNTNRLTAMIIAQSILEKIGESITEDTDQTTKNQAIQFITTLSNQGTLNRAFKVIVTPQELNDYSKIKTVTGSATTGVDKDRAYTYLVTMTLYKVADTDNNILVKATVNVYWWWGGPFQSEGEAVSQEIYLQNFQLSVINNGSQYNPSGDPNLLDPSSIASSKFIGNRRNYVQFTRYYYFPKNL